MYQGKIAVHWDKFKNMWRIYEGDTYINARSVNLKNAYFLVIPEGRSKIIEQCHRLYQSPKKNRFDSRFPHAITVGEYATGELPKEGWQELSYNPFTDRTFVIDKYTPLIEADFVRLRPDGAGDCIVRKLPLNITL